ncbi:hypothetical protein G7085_07950 [Tessaracoccus sp. HDW20]|uniref:hypothetical protein n=1 Tax=Tessaracoccus coleopterorum TaxID=2714950 RepID=UPI0018D3E1A4|nr:hypothetical protein [Tessaracoccus coleopterorum]NHB84566.1 hypothetical protein [Tessaracoccus coleopterorum]
MAVPLGISVLNQPNQNVANPAVGPTPTRTATDAPAPTGPAAATAAEACAAASEATTGWAELSGGDSPVKPGATRVWLCGDQMTAGPAEPLTVGVDELAGAFLDSGEADPNQACTMEYRLSYTLAFQYGDGTLVPLRVSCTAAAPSATGRPGAAAGRSSTTWPSRSGRPPGRGRAHCRTGTGDLRAAGLDDPGRSGRPGLPRAVRASRRRHLDGHP